MSPPDLRSSPEVATSSSTLWGNGSGPVGTVQQPVTARPAPAPGRGATPPDRAGTLSWPVVDAVVVAVLLATAATARLLSFSSTYDTFVDEYFYVDMGRSVAAGHLPPVGDGGPFTLHPPGFFVLEALWSGLLGVGGGYDEAVNAARLLQVLLALITVAGIYHLVRRASSRTTAGLAALVFALDPFVLRQNGRVLLETATLAFVVVGWLLAARAATATDRHRMPVAFAAGLTLGGAVVVKDMAAALTTLPLLVVWATGWLLPRREAVVAACASTMPYLLFVMVTVAQGGGQQLWQQKTGGLARALGLSVTTGFNAPGSQRSLLDAVIGQVQAFGGTFAVLLAGGVAGLLLVWRSRSDLQRVLGTVTVCSGGMVAYSMAFATAEEHFLYLCYVPALMTLAVAAHAHRRSVVAAIPRVRVVATAVAVVGLLSWDAAQYVQTRTTADDGQRRVTQWLRAHERASEPVAWISGQTRYQLAGLGLGATPLAEPADLAARRVRYLVVLHKEVDEGYTFTTPESVAWFAARSREVFTFSEPTYGRISVYETADPAQW